MPQLPPFAAESPNSFWSPHQARHALSRRAFLGAAAGTTGALVGTTLLGPSTALARTLGDDSPEPTTNTVTIGGVTFHLTSFGPGIDPSSITDFKGLVGVADVRGSGTATDPDGHNETLLFDTDMRFMSGTYIGRDNEVHHRSFGFI